MIIAQASNQKQVSPAEFDNEEFIRQLRAKLLVAVISNLLKVYGNDLAFRVTFIDEPSPPVDTIIKVVVDTMDFPNEL